MMSNQPIDYFTWLDSNPEIAKQVNAEVVTKPETLTVGEIFFHINQESVKYMATIGDVVHGSALYYIVCSGCKIIADVYGKVNVAKYCAKISIYDKSDQAVFVILGDAGRELTRKHASDLANSYFEDDENQVVDHEVHVKVSEHNLTGKTRAITFTKILSLDAPPPIPASVENTIAPTSEETLLSAHDVCEPSKICEYSAIEGMKRTCDSVEPEKAKGPKCGK